MTDIATRIEELANLLFQSEHENYDPNWPMTEAMTPKGCAMYRRQARALYAEIMAVDAAREASKYALPMEAGEDETIRGRKMEAYRITRAIEAKAKEAKS